MANDTLLNLVARAGAVIPGGVNSCIRNYPQEFIISKADGAYFFDQYGKRFTDFFAAGGPMIAGYNNTMIKEKVAQAVMRYDLNGIGASEPEVALAEKIVKHMKGAEQVLLCNGGSDATFHAIRMARALTGREKIVKMQGGFHGWHDYVLMNVNTPPEKAYKTDVESQGVLMDAANKTLICRINDADHLRDTCLKNKGEIAAVIVDPCNTALGCMPLDPDYVRALRSICDEEGIILIFDEIVTGFRLGLGGAVANYDIAPDMITMGKAIANGFPIAALAGKKSIMENFNTKNGGGVSYQATYYGHPMVAAAGVATIEELERPGFYERLEDLSKLLCDGIREIADRQSIEISTRNCGSLIGLYFGEGPYHNYDELLLSNDGSAAYEFRSRMIEKGQYMAVGPYRRLLLSSAHTSQDIAETLQAAEDTIKAMKSEKLFRGLPV